MENSTDSDIQLLNEQLQQAADGDLTVRLDENRDNKTVTQLSRSVNRMLAQLDTTLLGIQAFGVEVTTRTQQLSAGVEEIEATSKQVSQSTNEIAESTTRQTAKLSKAGDELTDLSATVEQIASSADEVATLSEAAADHASDGKKLAENSMATMGDLQSQAEVTVDRINHLESEMSEVTDIVDVIDDIADQTNMLALNASIEAARAGEAGDGFAVVADEVKSLAEETQNATADIANRVNELKQVTAATAEDIREMRERLESGIETVEQGLNALEIIAERVTEANDGIQSISAATDEQAESTQEIVQMIDEVISLSEQTSSETQTVSSAAEQQTEAITQAAENITQFDNLVVDLSSQLENFTVSEDDDTVLTNSNYDSAVRFIEETNEELLERSDDVVEAYTGLQNSHEYPDEINIAGRQRMLSQRIAKQTLFIARNERAGETNNQIERAKNDLESYIEEFQHALDALDDGGTHRGEQLAPAPSGVCDALDSVRSVWRPLRQNAETIINKSKFTTDVGAAKRKVSK